MTLSAPWKRGLRDSSICPIRRLIKHYGTKQFRFAWAAGLGFLNIQLDYVAGHGTNTGFRYLYWHDRRAGRCGWLDFGVTMRRTSARHTR